MSRACATCNEAVTVDGVCACVRKCNERRWTGVHRKSSPVTVEAKPPASEEEVGRILTIDGFRKTAKDMALAASTGRIAELSNRVEELEDEERARRRELWCDVATAQAGAWDAATCATVADALLAAYDERWGSSGTEGKK